MAFCTLVAKDLRHLEGFEAALIEYRAGTNRTAVLVADMFGVYAAQIMKHKYKDALDLTLALALALPMPIYHCSVWYRNSGVFRYAHSKTLGKSALRSI